MGLFDAIGNIFTTERSNRANEQNVQRQNDVSAQIARENNAAQLALWREQTAYNDPEAQMTRLEAAGLNPNLVYGNIAESKMATPPTLQAPDVNAPVNRAAQFSSDLNPVAEYQQTKNLQKLNALTSKKIEQVKGEAESATAQAEYDKWRYQFMKDNKMLSGNPVMNLGNRGIDLLDFVGKWIGSQSANITLEREKSR